MLDLGWSETFFVMVLALVVIGPRDLPKAARAVGRIAGQGRRLYRDFLASLQDLERGMQDDDRAAEDLGQLRLTPEQLRERRAVRPDPHGPADAPAPVGESEPGEGRS